MSSLQENQVWGFRSTLKFRKTPTDFFQPIISDPCTQLPGARELPVSVSHHTELSLFCFSCKFIYYSQSKAPFFHSYMKPTVKINKNIIMEQNPKIPILPNEMAHGKRKAISKSKIINKIATK